jgi:hypothetical protein
MRLMELEAGAGALAEYYDWFKDARTGDVLIYWHGDLQFDRDITNYPTLDDEQKARISVIDTLAKRIMSDAQDGYLVLSQQKITSAEYRYKATRRRLPGERSLEKARVRHADRVLA